MEKLITNLLIAIISSADNTVNYAFENMIEICFNAEKYLTEMLTVQVLDFSGLKKIILSFAISLAILKFLKKGVEMYLSWTEGNSDTPIHIYVLYFVRTIALILLFPYVYDIFVSVFKNFSDQLLVSLNVSTQENLIKNLTTISSVGLATSVLGLIELIMLILLYIQMLMRGVEMFVLKTSFPIFCIGLLDSNKGIFTPYIKKFFQNTFTVIIQIVLAKIVILLMSSSQLIVGIAVLLVALRTPKFLQEFMILAGDGRSGISNTIHTVSKVIELKGQLTKK